MLFGSKIDKIAKMAEKGQAEKLKPLAFDKKEDVRLAAIDALGKCPGEVAFNTLTLLIADNSVEVRKHVAAALGATNQVKARAFLEHRKEQEKDPSVLAAISDACKKIQSKI